LILRNKRWPSHSEKQTRNNIKRKSAKRRFSLLDQILEKINLHIDLQKERLVRTEPIDRSELTTERLKGREIEYLDAWRGRIMPMRRTIAGVTEVEDNEIRVTFTGVYGYIPKTGTWHPVRPFANTHLRLEPLRMFDIGRGRIGHLAPSNDHHLWAIIYPEGDTLTRDDISNDPVTLAGDPEESSNDE
jgi:hypothetical protein